MDIMLDLETLGTKPGCVVLSIGAIAFNPLGDLLPDAPETGRVFYQNLTIMDQLLLGLTIDPETMEWWQKQEPAAISALVPDQIVLKGGLFRLVTWLGNLPGPHRIWANSPDFDCAILEHCAGLLGVNLPWTFRDKCDLRTIKVVGTLAYDPTSGPPPEMVARAGTHHNALDDCYYQAATVQAIMKGIRNGKKAE